MARWPVKRVACNLYEGTKVSTENMCRLFQHSCLVYRDLWCENVEQVLTMIHLFFITQNAITTQTFYLRWEKSMSLQKKKKRLSSTGAFDCTV